MLVFEYKAVSLEYFLFKMQPSELRMAAENLRYSFRPLWDAARILSLYTVAPYSKKKLKLMDVFPLPWDSDDEPAHEENDILEHSKRMEQFAKLMSKKK